jgi:antitoxin component YwqK of YwqJK toxin-antitoxin module
MIEQIHSYRCTILEIRPTFENNESMKNNVLYSSLLLSIFIVACSNLKEKKEYYPTGEILENIQVDNNGMKQGERIIYFQNGDIMFKKYYINDTINGKAYEYYHKNILKAQQEYDKGLRVGVYKKYFESSKLQLIQHYNNKGKKEGEAIIYAENGKPVMKQYCINDFIVGAIEYDSLGTLKKERHTVELSILNSNLSIKDSVKIKAHIYDVYNQKISIAIQDTAVIYADVLKMTYNKKDSSYYYTSPPQKKAGVYLIDVFFDINGKNKNYKDTLVIIH